MIDLTFNGKDLGFNGKNLAYVDGPVNPYNPLNLPSGTIRYRFGDLSYDPSIHGSYDGIWTRVSSSPNIWDWSLSPDTHLSLVGRFGRAFNNIGTVDILGANLNGLEQPDLYETWTESGITSVAIMDTRGINNFNNTFRDCPNLQYVADGIPIARNCSMMFAECTNLRRVPLFVEETVTAEYLNEMFYHCYNVEGGILDFYDRFKNNPYEQHWACFRDCGINTTTGAAELAQLPDDWK